MNKKTINDIDKEVACSCLPDLAGLIIQLENYEVQQTNPNTELIELYKSSRNALWKERDNFYKYTDEQISWIIKELSPIFKQLSLSSNTENQRDIFIKHKQFFKNLVN